MIVANRKSLEEILNMLKPYRKVLLLGCNECVTVCAAGGGAGGWGVGLGAKACSCEGGGGHRG
jgi:hypothetical protein